MRGTSTGFRSLHFDINTFEQEPDDPGLSERGEANLDGLGIRPERLRAGSRLLAGEAGSAQASMDDGRAIALWDRVIASIRKRPG